ncbi:MAG: hypothetical protein MI757_02920 [Pirellulales bacterium]|nr:hypothetical protein [Pirellulales bacterium]
MICRSTKFVTAASALMCMALVASWGGQAYGQDYEGYPVFWGKRDALKRAGSGPATDAEPVRIRRRAGSEPVQQVQYTEVKSTDGVIIQKSTPEEIVGGEVIHEGKVIIDDGDMCGCGDPCGDACGTACGPYGNGCIEGMFRGMFQGIWQRSEVFFGMQGYKGPLDNGENGNFGFHQGFNLGFPLLPSYGIGAQFGATFTQSDLSGYSVQSFDTDSSRNQQFITVGIFERATECCPLQWGFVFDYLSDDIADTDYELRQLRGEIGYLTSDTGEIGFWFTTSDESEIASYNGAKGSFGALVETTDLYAFYYRHTSCEGNELRLWAGFTGRSDGLFGGDFQVPLSDQFALRGAANYLIPNEDDNFQGTFEESWGIGMSIVWYPGRRARCVSSDLYAPLLRPADNSTFMVDVLEN